MAKTKKTPKARIPSRPVSLAAKDPITTAKFLDDIDEAMATFDDEITSISANQHEVAYENLAKSYREAFTLVWDKASNTDVQPIIDAIPDKQLLEFKKLKWLLHPGQAKPKVIQEPGPVPALEQILGAMTSRLPEQDLPDKDVCKTIANVFSDLTTTHMSQAKAAKGLAELATMVSPEQMTLILAATVPPTIQLALPTGSISPLSTPPPPLEVTTTQSGRRNLIMYCKTQILPDAFAPSFQKYSKRSPTHVLVAALYYAVERRYFEEKTSRADIASMFLVITNRLMKAVTGVDYESGPHPYKRKRTTDATSTTLSKVAKTAADTTPSTSHKDSPATSTEAIVTKTVKGHQVMKALRKMTKDDTISQRTWRKPEKTH